jgi:hypothetical protein
LKLSKGGKPLPASKLPIPGKKSIDSAGEKMEGMKFQGKMNKGLQYRKAQIQIRKEWH